MVNLSTLRRNLKESYGNLTEIDIIIMNTLNIDKSRLFIDISVSKDLVCDIEEKVRRLKNNEPVEYITGHKEFMSLDFSVNTSTLIPRADTEILIEEILKLCDGKKITIFDVGTGSGCIAISLAYYLPQSTVYAFDISEKALETAKINAVKNGVDTRVKFIKQDILKGFPALDIVPDIIVSNPPYIETEVIETLEDKVKNYEPLSALDGGQDGLIFYRKIINENPLQENGILAFEVGFNQGYSVSELMKNDYSNVQVIKDLGGNNRVVLGTKKVCSN